MPPENNHGPIDITLIGSGQRGMAWLSTVTSPEAAALGLRLAGICDLNPASDREPLHAMAPDGCVTSHYLPAALALQTRIVIDATSPVTRLAVTQAAIQAGAQVLCDPPLALDDATALALIGAAARGPGGLIVAHLSRHRMALSQMRDLVASGQCGRPLALRVHLPVGEHASPRTLLQRPMADAFDAGRAILGGDGATATCLGPPFRATFEMTNAARLTVETGHDQEHWQLELEGGIVTCGDSGPATLPDGTVVDGPPQPEGRLAALIDLVEVIRAGRAPQCGPRSAASSLAMALAAHASARRGGSVKKVLHLGLMGDASGRPARRPQRADSRLTTEVP